MASSLDTTIPTISRAPQNSLPSYKNIGSVGEQLQKGTGLEGIIQKTIDPITSPEDQKNFKNY